MDAQHQATPEPTARLLMRLAGFTPGPTRGTVAAFDVAAEPDTALAPRWGGRQIDGGFVDSIADQSPWGDGWWCNPTFGDACVTCGGISPTPDRAVKVPGLLGGLVEQVEPGCKARGHRIINMAHWSARVALEAQRHRGALICKLDGTNANRVLREHAELVVMFDERVHYLHRGEGGELELRRGVNFPSVGYVIGPTHRRWAGCPPVIWAKPDGAEIWSSPQVDEVLVEMTGRTGRELADPGLLGFEGAYDAGGRRVSRRLSVAAGQPDRRRAGLRVLQRAPGARLGLDHRERDNTHARATAPGGS